ARVVNTKEPQLLFDGTAYISGEIPRITPFETGLPGQHRLAHDGKSWEPDELIMDERFLAVNVKGKGLAGVSACSHAGIINVLTNAKASFPNVPLLRRAWRIALIWHQRADNPANRRGYGEVRSSGDRSWPLHRLARDSYAPTPSILKAQLQSSYNCARCGHFGVDVHRETFR